MSDVQATVSSFDPRSGSGAVLLDDGRCVTFSPQAFAAGGLRLLRPGQRVRLTMGPAGDIEAITILTLQGN